MKKFAFILVITIVLSITIGTVIKSKIFFENELVDDFIELDENNYNTQNSDNHDSEDLSEVIFSTTPDIQNISKNEKPLSYINYFATEKTELYTHEYDFYEGINFITDKNNRLYGYTYAENDVPWPYGFDYFDNLVNKTLIIDENVTSWINDEYIHVIINEHELVRFNLDGTNRISLYKDDEKISQLSGNHEVMCFIKNNIIYRIHFESGIVDKMCVIDDEYDYKYFCDYAMMSNINIELTYTNPEWKLYNNLTEEEKIKWGNGEELYEQDYEKMIDPSFTIIYNSLTGEKNKIKKLYQ